MGRGPSTEAFSLLRLAACSSEWAAIHSASIELVKRPHDMPWAGRMRAALHMAVVVSGERVLADAVDD